MKKEGMSILKILRDRALTGAALAILTVLVGCASPRYRAPVEDRGAMPRPPAAAQPAATGNEAAQATEAAKPLPGAENAGKPGYYTIKPGDTLIRVGLENGQNWKDLVKWNNLENPNVIEVGQVIRVVPPGAEGTLVRPIASTKVEARPLDAKPVPSGSGASAPPVASSASGAPTPSAPVAAVPTPAPAAPAAPAMTPTKDIDDEVTWQWPSNGAVGANFEEGKTKGLVITGKAGDPVYAAADGRVVYAGSGLRGYGNLVILKHNSTYLTAYAHNQTLLVKEDQAVRRGQKIAEMGASDADRVQLHFEIRRQGKPVDPARLLPAR